MLNNLYPLSFKPIYKERIWGGQKLYTVLNKDFYPLNQCGESWEISSVEDNISIVADGFLKDKSLQFLIDEYKGLLVGTNIYQKFGNTFPLLIKFLDANDDLSIQVHPNDQIAQQRHQSCGKTEMWYIVQADEGAIINTGFNKEITKEEYIYHLENGTLSEILNFEKAENGAVFFLPAGRVHYIGKGCLIAEIQQTSDITYRIYDFDRVDAQGNKRELHTSLALDCLDFKYYDNYKTSYNHALNQQNKLVNSPYFNTNFLHVDGKMHVDYQHLDSFVIYMIVEGALSVKTDNYISEIKMGECLLIPACLKEVELVSDGAKLLEIWVD